MEKNQKLVIGLFGFGVVGEGLYRVLLQTPALNATIKKVCILNPEKKRNAPGELFTTDRNVILADPEINVVVEVIDDAEAAFLIVSTALRSGKHAVSASKKMIAANLPELLSLQEQTGRSLLYEAAACASIPVIRNLEEYYDNDLLFAIRAIVNGSTNFILSKMFREDLSYRDALLLAQQSGFAESNPLLDVEGHDAANKWSFLLTHAYGILPAPESLLYNGITDICAADTRLAREKSQQVKLVAQAQKLSNGQITAFVLPQFIRAADPLAFVQDEYNGVVIESGFADRQFFYGKGAGSYPTASAVLSDISALRYGYRYEYKKLYRPGRPELSRDVFLKAYVSFDDSRYVPRDHFEWIEEWHAMEERKYLIGVIAMEKLLQENWWRENNNSLILAPEAIIENLDLRNLKKKSLELAGIG